jgi:hypothetical protein
MLTIWIDNEAIKHRAVIAGLVPAIPIRKLDALEIGMRGSSPRMTGGEETSHG